MRSLKVSGGLTRGRGMDDNKRSLWLYSLPARAELNNAIQDLTNLKTETSEQHKECGKARQQGSQLHLQFSKGKKPVRWLDSKRIPEHCGWHRFHIEGEY